MDNGAWRCSVIFFSPARSGDFQLGEYARQDPTFEDELVIYGVDLPILYDCHHG
jgi:hypothetical protein